MEFNNGSGIFIQIGAGAGDLDKRANFRDGFTELIKSLPRDKIKKIILVEPNPLNITLLHECWKDYPEAIIYEIAIIPKKIKKDYVELYYCPEDAPHFQVASIDKLHVQKHYGSNCDLQKFTIPTRTLEEFIISVTSEEIEVLGLDIEGIDAEVILDLNFNNIKVKYFSFEYIHLGENRNNVINHMENNNFKYLGNGLDPHGYDYLYVKKNNIIPKNIFQSWNTTSLHPTIQEKIDYMKEINPDYNHKIYTDEEIDCFVNENFPGEIADCYNKLNIIVAKVDFWRYLILYKCGGIYLDMDSSINKPLNKLIQEHDEAIITAEKNPNTFVQWALIFNKEHPILKKTIELIVENIKFNKYPNDIHKMTGPSVFSQAVNIVHYNNNARFIRHNLIHKNFDMTFKCRNSSYRIYGIDYNEHLTFKHDSSQFLYNSKQHWREEEKIKPLLL